MKSLSVVRLASWLLVLAVAVADVYADQSAAPQGTQSAPTAVASSEPSKAKLEISWENKLVTLDVVDSDIQTTMKTLSEKTGVDIQVHAGVSGKVTLRLEKAPLEKAVDSLLAAVGQRNYLMVFDGGGLTKMTIVPKGTAGAVPSEEMKRVKVKGKLKNGKEIEYYPGEIIVGSFGIPGDLPTLIARLEARHGLALMKTTKVSLGIALKFRILGGRDVLTVMYEILATNYGYSLLVTPNGLGSRSVEMPEEDFHVWEGNTAEDRRIYTARKMNQREYKMEKYAFMKWGEIYPGKMEYPYIESELSINVSHSDDERIQFDDVLALVNDEGGILTGYGKDRGGAYYRILFPDVIGTEAYGKAMERLQANPLFKRAREKNTSVGFVPWGVTDAVPGDPE